MTDQCEVSMRRCDGNQSGLTLVELIVAFTIMLILTTMAVPLARSKVRAERERDLRDALREMRSAIDKYKDYCDLGYLGPPEAGHQLLPGNAGHPGGGRETARPRRQEDAVPAADPDDPFTGKTEWGMRSDQDDPKSSSWGGQNVFDVYSKTTEKAADGTPYSEW